MSQTTQAQAQKKQTKRVVRRLVGTASYYQEWILTYAQTYDTKTHQHLKNEKTGEVPGNVYRKAEPGQNPYTSLVDEESMDILPLVEVSAADIQALIEAGCLPDPDADEEEEVSVLPPVPSLPTPSCPLPPLDLILQVNAEAQAKAVDAATLAELADGTSAPVILPTIPDYKHETTLSVAGQEYSVSYDTGGPDASGTVTVDEPSTAEDQELNQIEDVVSPQAAGEAAVVEEDEGEEMALKQQAKKAAAKVKAKSQAKATKTSAKKKAATAQANGAAVPPKNKSWGQGGPPLDLSGKKLNKDETAVLALLVKRDAKSQGEASIALMAEVLFKTLDEKKANSHVRNALRRLVRGGLVAKETAGSFFVTDVGLAYKAPTAKPAKGQTTAVLPKSAKAKSKAKSSKNAGATA